MGLLSTIFGPRAVGGEDDPPRTVDTANAALTRLNNERSRALREIDDFREKRRALLLIDDSDSDIRKIEREIEKRELLIERLDQVEPAAIAALTAARNEARRIVWGEIRARHFAAAAKFLAAMREAHAAFETVISISDEASNKGFREAVFTFIPPPRVIDRELLNHYDVLVTRAELQSDPSRGPASPVEAPAAGNAPPPQARTPAAPKPKTDAAPLARKATPPPPPAPEFKPFKPTPDADGRIKVIILRTGSTLADGSKPKLNDVVALPEAEAYGLVRTAVGEFEGAAQ